MKTAVIYYSLDGNCALVAETIKAQMGAEVFEIKLADAKKRRGFAKFAWGVSQVVKVMTGIKPEILPLSVDPSAFDLVILGTPVWAGSPAPAIASFLDKNAITGKKIALFCCHGGGKGAVFDKLKALLPGNTFAGEIDFVTPAKTGEAGLKDKIAGWAKTLEA